MNNDSIIRESQIMVIANDDNDHDEGLLSNLTANKLLLNDDNDGDYIANNRNSPVHLHIEPEKISSHH